MAYRTLTPAIVQTVLAHWQRKRALHWIARATQIDRKTVRRYAQAATAFVLARTPMPRSATRSTSASSSPTYSR